MKKRSLLIFEPFVSGHRLDHIRHIVDYVEKNKISVKIILLVNPEFTIDKFRLILKHTKLKTIHLTKNEIKKLNTSNHFLHSIYQLIILNKKLTNIDVQNIFIDSLDKIYNVLAFGFKLRGSVKLSGIIYRADLHYNKLYESMPLNIKQKVNKLRKASLLKLFLKHKQVESIFTFDEFLPNYLNKYHNIKKVYYLPDPALFSVENIKFGWPELDRMENKKIFSLFGYIDYRKGVLQLLDALKLIHKEDQNKIAVVISGKIDEKILSTFKNKLNKVKDDSQITFIIKEDFIPFEELTYLVFKSDIILAPYINFPGSSGVILWASSAGKPVITQKYGLLGALVNKYKLGITCDTNNPSEIADAINYFISNNEVEKNIFDKNLIEKYVMSCTPDNFAKTIIDSVL